MKAKIKNLPSFEAWEAGNWSLPVTSLQTCYLIV